MKFTLVAFALIIAVAVAIPMDELALAATAKPDGRLTAEELAEFGITGHEIFEFVLGVVEGIGSTLVPSIEECISDAVDLVNDFIQAYNYLVRDDPRSFVSAAGKGCDAIYNALTDCGSIESEIEEVAELLESGGLSIIYHAGKALIVHGVEIYGYVHSAYNDFETDNWKGAGTDIGDIIGTLLS